MLNVQNDDNRPEVLEIDTQKGRGGKLLALGAAARDARRDLEAAGRAVTSAPRNLGACESGDLWAEFCRSEAVYLAARAELESAERSGPVRWVTL